MRRVLVSLFSLSVALATVDASPSLSGIASPGTDALRKTILESAAAQLAVPDLTVLTTEPVERTESSGYGWREDPVSKRRQKFHHGSDYRGKRGAAGKAAPKGISRSGRFSDVIG